jgi:hypothetical protein
LLCACRFTFHALTWATQGTKHTCQMMLERHNSRRRDRVESAEGATSAPPAAAPRPRGRPAGRTGPSSGAGGGGAGPNGASAWSIPGDFLPAGLDDIAGMESFLMNSEALGGLLSELPAEPEQAQSAFAAALLGAPLPLPLPVPPPTWPAVDLLAPYAQPPGMPLGMALGGLMPPLGPAVASAPELLRSVVAHIKLHDVGPQDLPRGLADMVRAWLGGGVLDALAYVRPGCTLLTVHALARGGAAVAPGGTVALLAALATLRLGRIDAWLDAPVPHLPPMRPLAVCSAAPAVLRSVAPCAASGPLLVRVGGATLCLPPDAASAQAGECASCALPALPGAQGLALLELCVAGGARLRPVVLTADAAIAAELAALGDDADAGTPGCCTAAGAEAVALAVGGALAPGAPAALLRLAAAAAARHALHATLATLLQRLAASGSLDMPQALDAATSLRLRAAVAAADDVMARVQRERGIFAPPHALEAAAELLASAPARADAMALLTVVLNEVRCLRMRLLCCAAQR